MSTVKVTDRVESGKVYWIDVPDLPGVNSEGIIPGPQWVQALSFDAASQLWRGFSIAGPEPTNVNCATSFCSFAVDHVLPSPSAVAVG